jgi:hypothetical protein
VRKRRNYQPPTHQEADARETETRTAETGRATRKHHNDGGAETQQPSKTAGDEQAADGTAAKAKKQGAGEPTSQTAQVERASLKSEKERDKAEEKARMRETETGKKAGQHAQTTPETHYKIQQKHEKKKQKTTKKRKIRQTPYGEKPFFLLKKT